MTKMFALVSVFAVLAVGAVNAAPLGGDAARDAARFNAITVGGAFDAN